MGLQSPIQLHYTTENKNTGCYGVHTQINVNSRKLVFLQKWENFAEKPSFS